MIKVKEFWNVVCDVLDYRFFSGVACAGFDSVYRKMNPKKMHYIPAIDGSIAINLALGAALNNIKSGVFLDSSFFNVIPVDTIKFIKECSCPFMVFVYSSDKNEINSRGLLKIDINLFELKSELIKFDKKIVRRKIPGIVNIKKDI